MAEIQKPMPWHQELWSDWLRLMQNGRVPHGVLLSGIPGLGKGHLGRALAASLMCNAAFDQRPCGSCKGCELLKAGTHPDLKLLEPEAPGKAIRVDQVRALVDFLATTAQQGGWKCVIIQPADAMNMQAANALLKSLEEPPGSSLILLVSSNPSRLLPTLRSRCRQLIVKTPPRELSLKWLESQLEGNAAELLDYAHGAPCAALVAAADKALELRSQMDAALLGLATGQRRVEEAVKQFLEQSPLQVLDNLLAILTRLAQAQSGAEAIPAQWAAFLQSRDGRLLFSYFDRVLKAKRELLSGGNPNPQLLWEDLLIAWQSLAGTATAA